MSQIKNLLSEAVNQNKFDHVSFMTGDKRFKEQWVLGKFTLLYNQGRSSRLEYAAKLEENHVGNTPDFAVYDEKKVWIADVEITEAMDCRVRDVEYKSSEEAKWVDIENVDYISIVQKRINDKCQKQYPTKTWLIIYQNVFSSIQDNFATPKLFDLKFPQECIFEKMFILDSDGRRYISLYSKCRQEMVKAI